MKITSANAFLEIRKQIQKIEKFSFQYSHNLKKNYGVTGPQVGILKAIVRNNSKSITMTELSKTVGAHITTVEGMVNRLREQKLLKKQKNKNDKRVVDLSVTEKGREIIKRVPLGAMGQLYHNLEKISDEEAKQIYTAIARLAELCGADDTEFD